MNSDKTVQASNVPTQTSTNLTRGQVSHDQIARRAEKLWQDRGEPTGQDDAIWLEAESLLKAESESQPVAGTDSRPYVDEPAHQLRSRTKTQDPADSAAQVRSPTERKSKSSAPRVRNQ